MNLDNNELGYGIVLLIECFYFESQAVFYYKNLPWLLQTPLVLNSGFTKLRL